MTEKDQAATSTIFEKKRDAQKVRERGREGGKERKKERKLRMNESNKAAMGGGGT